MSQKKKRRPKPLHVHGAVQFSASDKIFGAGLFGASALLLLFAVTDRTEPQRKLVSAAVVFIILSILIIMHYHEAVVYDDSGFIYRNMLGIRTRIEWAQITQIREEQGYYGGLHISRPKPFKDIIITAEGKRIRLDGGMEHFGDFRMLLTMKCTEKFDSPQDES